MRFGLAVPHYGFSLAERAPIRFEDAAEWARRAEDLGFDSVWVSDHLFYSFARYGADGAPISSLEALTTLGGIAAVTERVRLGTLVLASAFRHPSVLAKAAATLDAISGGRLDLGLGAGWFEDEYRAFGIEFGSVGARFDALEEALHVLEALLAGGPVTFEGTTVTLREARLSPSPVQRPIPLWIGGKGGPRLLRLAARHAAGWNVVWRISPQVYADKLADVRRACEREARDPSTLRLSVGLHSLIGETEAEARAAFERGRAAFPGGALDGETYESWRGDTLTGTPEQILERVDAFASLGVEELVISPWVLPFAVPEPELVELLAERVVAPLRSVLDR